MFEPDADFADSRFDAFPSDADHPDAVSARDREAWLLELQQRVGPPPRAMGLGYLFGRWAAPRPPWLLEADPLKLFYEHRRRVIQTGHLRWGVLIKVETRDGPADQIGSVVFCPDEHRDVPVEQLLAAADRLGRLTADDLDPADQKLLAFLALPEQRAFGYLIPPHVTPGAQLALSSTLLFRRHLPRTGLADRVLPLLVPPDGPHTVMVVPSSFWPKAMRKR